MNKFFCIVTHLASSTHARWAADTSTDAYLGAMRVWKEKFPEISTAPPHDMFRREDFSLSDLTPGQQG